MRSGCCCRGEGEIRLLLQRGGRSWGGKVSGGEESGERGNQEGGGGGIREGIRWEEGDQKRDQVGGGEVRGGKRSEWREELVKKNQRGIQGEKTNEVQN